MGSRRLARSDSEQDLKAVFLTVFKSLEARVKSKEELLFALQQTGRNPSAKVLSQHWTTSSRGMSFDEFVSVCKKMPATTQDDLMHAFQRMDANGDGFISREEFLRAMTSKGEKMTLSEVASIIDRVDANRDGRLDYEEFCNLILSNVEEAKAAARRRMGRSQENSRKEAAVSDDDEVETPARRQPSPVKPAARQEEEEEEDDDDDIVIGDSRTSLRSRSRQSDRSEKGEFVTFAKTIGVSFEEREPRNLRRWTKCSRRGCFYLEDIGNRAKAVLSHKFSFRVRERSSLFVKVAALECKSLDISAPDVNLLLVKGSRPVCIGDQTSPQGRAQLRATLEPGDYELFPLTSGLKFRARSSQPKAKALLLKKERDGRLALTKACKDALSDIFRMADLDGNGYLNKKEFSHYIMRTSGERLEEGLWEVVEENCSLHEGEIRLEDFIELNLKEAEQDKGDTENLWITLDSMGFNHQLFLDEAFPMTLDFFLETGSSRFDVAVTELDLESQSAVDRALVALVLEQGEKQTLPTAPDCRLAFLPWRCGALLVGDNRTPESRDLKQRTGITLEADFSGSENLQLSSDPEELQIEMGLKSGKREIISWIVPKDLKSPWKIVCDLQKRS